VLTSRKSSSTPSLTDVEENKPSVASTEQAASAENLTSKVKSVRISCDIVKIVHYETLFLSKTPY
jgi:hypothetical protein